MMESLLQHTKECYLCRKLYGIKTVRNLHKHHIFEGTANRKKSEQYGLYIYLCGKHHNLSDLGIHSVKGYELEVKREAQEAFEKEYGHDEFMQIFKRNYL